MPAAVQLTIGLVALYFGGEWLIRGATALASRLGVSPLAIGLTVVAFGTSTPELVVSLDAVLSGANDIAVGNVVGSNIANIGLILGLAALVRPAVVQAKIVRVDLPIMVAVSLVLAAVLADGGASRTEGFMLLVALVAYCGFTFWEAGRESPRMRDELAGAAPSHETGAGSAALFVVVGLLLLVAGGHFFVAGAVDLARAHGVSQAAIGLTVVAVGTSLPELVTSVLASRRGKGDIAVGNVVGSNIFNILGIVGVTALVRPLELGGIGPPDLVVLVGLAVATAAAVRFRGGLGRVEGTALLAVFAWYSSWQLGGAG